MSISAATIGAAAAEYGLQPVSEAALQQLSDYAALMMRWNTRLNLSAIRDGDEVLYRHLLEGMFAAQHVSPGATTLLDFGSGVGIPGVPIAICRPDIQVTLAESNQKKASFLREVGRLVAGPLRVHAGRVEDLPPGTLFDTVTMRAVDRMEKMVVVAAGRVAGGGDLMLLSTGERLERLVAGLPGIDGWRQVLQPRGAGRLLAIGRKSA